MDTKFDMNGWRIIKDKLRNKYPDLTDVDLDWGRVSREDLIQNISIKLGKTKKELMDEIDSLEYSS
ncbi:general stress protein CsbD [Maribellus comscasis]|uniref:General stress protein CsbD n=1 Tax=Maribellus comscasis TaxID=2681766 RepID=A0A6I6K7V1_9BACT|nr:general stress protein CsbD [Maribellus comscasis]QGY46114.1 general stress protein CsbD [Maribellus comscasis]